MRRNCIVVGLSLVALLVAAIPLSAQTAPGPSTVGGSQGLATLTQAAQAKKYAFIFFWKVNDDQTRRMFGVFKDAMSKLSNQAEAVAIQLTNPAEQVMVQRFGVSRAPMPMVLAVAPNGAVTKGLPINFTEEQLRQAIVSPGTATCLKALQNRKLVLICVQSPRSQFRQISWQAAQDFRMDPRFAKSTEVISIDPSNAQEASFLKELRVDSKSTQAITVLLAPPGKVVASFVGGVSKDQIAAKLAAAQSNCCPGGKCGPGGCKP